MSNLVEVTCEACKLPCFKTLGYYNGALKKGTKTFYHGECYKTSRKREKYFCKPKIEVTCDYCLTKFKKYQSKVAITAHNFCNMQCMSKFEFECRVSKIELNCPKCSKQYYLLPSVFKTRCKQSTSNENLFCSRNCFYEHLKTIPKFFKPIKHSGSRRSKLEKFIQTKIEQHFPKIDVIYNGKYCNFELDIYFPNLNYAIEINGILHYQPIYGNETLIKIQNRDVLKKYLCKERNVTLDIISVLEATKSEVMKIKYWNIISNLIECQIQNYKFLPNTGFEFHEIKIPKQEMHKTGIEPIIIP